MSIIDFPDDVFQIFLEFNDQPEIVGLLNWIDEKKDYRVKKYVYFISNEIKRREMEKLLESRKKDEDESNDHYHGRINYENILSNTKGEIKPYSKIIGNLDGGCELDDFFNVSLTQSKFTGIAGHRNTLHTFLSIP